MAATYGQAMNGWLIPVSAAILFCCLYPMMWILSLWMGVRQWPRIRKGR